MRADDSSSSSVALITGAGKGIGLEVARQLGERGMTTIVTARTCEQSQAAAERIGGAERDIRAKTLDVTDQASVEQLKAEIEDEFGRLDVLVNNAAAFVNWSETALTADLEAASAVLATNLFGAWRMCQVFMPLLRRSTHGRIVIVSSGAGSHGEQQFGLTTGGGSVASYGISKAALNALTAKLAAELAGTGILVNAVCPGFTATAPGIKAMGARPIPEGAASVVWAATLPDDGPSGGFFRDGQPLPW
ncbi:MAG: SDR family NAD(P)-dependent oxidoreductase [Chloroflexi bacterium]|nr:SDR family NAD(P)-dependent oxidoreductase [Chloroflexota bacterium]